MLLYVIIGLKVTSFYMIYDTCYAILFILVLHVLKNEIRILFIFLIDSLNVFAIVNKLNKYTKSSFTEEKEGNDRY